MMHLRILLQLVTTAVWLVRTVMEKLSYRTRTILKIVPEKRRFALLFSKDFSDVDVPSVSKLKKAHGIEQYVCRKCGRTDSPEWRKVDDHKYSAFTLTSTSTLRDLMARRLFAMLVVSVGRSRCVSLMNLQKKRGPTPASRRQLQEPIKLSDDS